MKSRDLLKSIKERTQLFAHAQLLRTMQLLKQDCLYRPRLLPSLPGESILSVAPHPDDDVFACGGTLSGIVQQGGHVTSVVLTDGARGGEHPGGKLSLVAKRRQEAEQAAEILGVENLHFLNYKDQDLHPDRKIREILHSLIEEYFTETVLIPFPIDYHPDHIAAVRVVLDVLLDSHPEIYVFCYECVAPILPNVIVNISKEIDKKRAAVRCFSSQMETNDYEWVIVEGLNRFRTHGLLHGQGYAEAFFQTSTQQLRNLLRFLHGG